MTGLTGLTGPTGRGAAGLEPITGVCSAVFAYDIGFAIDLEAAERSLELGQRAGLSPTRRAPHYVQYRPAPLRVTRRAATIPLGAYQTAADVSALVYDFGAVSITFQVPISGPLESLLGLSAALSDNPELLAASRRRAQELLEEIRPAVGKASLADLVEDYAIFHLHSPGPPGGATTGESPLRFVARHRELLARVLRAETGRLSSQEVRDALASRLAYAPTDLV
ncbi:MAG TPA: hypothetical protein VD963_03340, partial [Phycisphaerales bacterium]|nr:hypothetical protein [Phycisphaerales bacterium]